MNVVMLSAVMLSVVMLSAVVLNVVAPLKKVDSYCQCYKTFSAQSTTNGVFLSTFTDSDAITFYKIGHCQGLCCKTFYDRY